MDRRIDSWGTARKLILSLWRILGFSLRFGWAMVQPRAVLAARLLAAESQLAMCVDAVNRKKAPKPRPDQAFRLLWIVLSKLTDGWEGLIHIVQPATVVKWHKKAFRMYWRWKSRPGRSPISRTMQARIRRFSRENPLWGAERIREELENLGFSAPCEETVRKYMAKSRKPGKKTPGWLPFLHNHLEVAWAMDFLTVVTANFSFLYLFVVFEHGRRRVIHFATTYHPSMEWVIQQPREATPFGRQPRYVFRDNDGIYGQGVRLFLNRCGIEEVRTAYQSPCQNPYIERFFGTLRRELLDHVIVLSQRHLNRLLREYLEQYYHASRPHQGLNGDTPVSTKKPEGVDESIKLIWFPVCGALHHRYERIAA